MDQAVHLCMRIILIGFMCSGKTAVGRALAEALSIPHVDLDRKIEERVGPLQPWFIAYGEEAFRRAEREVLLESLELPSAVISAGGGTPCWGDNLDRMHAAGSVVYLHVPEDILVPRIERKGMDRPLLMGLKGADLHRRIKELLEAREQWYERAHAKVASVAEPSAVAEAILRTLGLKDQDR